MPLYKYKCTTCKKTFEEIKPISERKLAECPHCGGQGKMLIGAPMGYVTDTKNPTRC